MDRRYLVLYFVIAIGVAEDNNFLITFSILNLLPELVTALIWVQNHVVVHVRSLLSQFSKIENERP